MSYKLLGWINVITLGILLGPYVLNYLNNNVFKTKKQSFRDLVKSLRKFHKPLGIILIVTGVIHGYMALGAIRLHTGTLLYVSLIITGFIGGFFYRTKKRVFFIWHRRMAFLTVALLVLHLIFPSAVYYILN